MTAKQRPNTLPATGPYAVGYGKPPVATRFQPGVSGNPKGRPKGSRNRRKLKDSRLQDIIIAEAYRDIPVRDGERMIDIPIAQAVVRALAVNAAKGQPRAQTLFTQLLTATEQAQEAEFLRQLENAFEYKVNWELELDHRARTGATGPEPLPHPDDVHINMNTGAVHIRGPITRQEQAEIEMWKERVADFEEELDFLRELRQNEKSDEERLRIDLTIQKYQCLVRMMRKRIAYDYQGIREEYAKWKAWPKLWDAE